MARQRIPMQPTYPGDDIPRIFSSRPVTPAEGDLVLSSELPILGLGSQQRGPNGRWLPTATPEYTTTADVTGLSNEAEIQTALNACTGGEVLEIDADFTGVQLVLDTVGGASSWTENVLIRPQLGTRREVQSVEVNCPHVTLAGLDCKAGDRSPFPNMTIQAARSFLWRCVDKSNFGGQWRINSPAAGNADGAGIIACASPHWRWSHGGDRVNITGSGGSIKNTIIEGCYFAPVLAGVLFDAAGIGDTWSSGTYDNPGNPVSYYTANALADLPRGGSPAHTAGEVVTISGGNTGGGTVGSTMTLTTGMSQAIQVYLDDAQPTGPATFSFFINGVAWTTVQLVAPDYRYGTVRLGNKPTALVHDFVSSDVITMSCDQDFTGAHVIIGIDAQSGPGVGGPDNHADDFQIYGTIAAPVLGMQVRGNVIGGTNSNEPTQFNLYYGGEFVWEDNFVGFGTSHTFGGNQSGLNELTTMVRHAMLGNDFQSQLRAGTQGGLRVFQDNTYPSITGGYTPDVTNTATGTSPVTPDCPDLAAVWPECPYEGPY